MTIIDRFGIDVGGSSVKIGAFDKDDNMLLRDTLFTEPETVFGDIEAALRHICKTNGHAIEAVRAIGIGVPGPVRSYRYVDGCVNMNLAPFDIMEKFQLPSSIRIVAENDANLAAMGEFHYGAAKPYRHALVTTLGTGIGAGVIYDGHLLTGAHAAAGELGHIRVTEHLLEELASDKEVELEELASGIAMEHVARRFLALDAFAGSGLRNVTPTAENIFRLAETGDALSIKLVNITASYLGLAFSYACAVVDFDAIIIGGGVSRAGDYLIDRIARYYREYAFRPMRDTVFLRAALGNDAGIYGAAALIKE